MQAFARHVRALLGLQLTAEQLRAFEVYERELLAWNQVINLTAIHEPETIRVKHFLDSLSCLPVMRDRPVGCVVDIGSGAGFPGLPLKLVCPGMRLTLVESVKKKADFCQHVVQKLRLGGVTVSTLRAEVLGQSPEHREAYDWALARAVAQLPVLVEYLLPLLRIGGAMIAMKGESGPAEAHQAERAIRMLGGRLRSLAPVELPGVAEERYLVVVDKVAATAPMYPRRVGVPRKHPL
ncbi:MAG: 16S rRNA (guanine(527)-N(7))-methyltransferase RsmG [Anaerolineales bacterium]|nr:16S rRNA (guanine(527)-N(7))-methyltransferase RsmG [Anaerolineales bacterium]